MGRVSQRQDASRDDARSRSSRSQRAGVLPHSHPVERGMEERRAPGPALADRQRRVRIPLHASSARRSPAIAATDRLDGKKERQPLSQLPGVTPSTVSRLWSGSAETEADYELEPELRPNRHSQI